MLDDYKEKEPIVYKQLKNIINDNLSHAFLFIKNKNLYADKIINSFMKSIICKDRYTNKKACNDCNICERIDKKEYSEIKIIKPEGLWIKKEQLIELQREMSTKALEGEKRIYVIYEAEKMNSSAANCLLKFLEEPPKNIVAILITDEYGGIIDTIASRCQTIAFYDSDINEYAKLYNYKNKTLLKLHLLYKNNQNTEEYMNNSENVFFLENIINFILKYEEKKINMICDNKKYFIDIFKQKEDIYYSLEVMILFYKDVLKFIIKREVDIFENYLEKIREVANKNDKQKIIYKLNIMIKNKENIKSGMNINLFLEKLIIELEGGVKNA